MQQLILLAVLGGAVIGAALLLRVLPHPALKLRLRRSVLLYATYAVLTGVLLAGRDQIPKGLEAGLETAADFVLILLAITLVALVVFDLTARLVRFKFPEIVHDVSVGVAYIFAGVWLMHHTGVNVASIVATSAVATAVIGLSLQSTLGSVIGGLALQVDDSLSAGDWIELENHQQGCVKKVRWRHTLIETRDGDTLVVPNNQLLNQTIKLLGKREDHALQRRTWVHFNVDFRYAPSQVIRVVEDTLRGAPLKGMSKEPAPQVICHDLARDGKDSFGYYAVRYWLLDFTSPDTVSSAVRERIYVALKRAQIPLAMPAAAHFVSKDDPVRADRKRQQEVTKIATSLSRVEIFAGLSETELQDLALSVQVAPFSAGEVVTRQGAVAHWLYVLTRGEVEVRVHNGSEERRVTTLMAPSFFGEMALMTGAPREATVVALMEVECVRVDKADFRALIERRPELANDVAVVLAERRVALLATREGLDAEAKQRRVERERTHILSTVRAFFGLNG